MKELEKTKRISIASVLFILVVIIGLLSYKRPKHMYTQHTKEGLATVVESDCLLKLEDVNDDQILVDVRSRFDYEKGHLDGAINIYAPEILSDENTKLFEQFKADNKTVILYGTNPNEALPAFMLLSQLGFGNLKILSVQNSYDQNKLITENVQMEQDAPDVNAFIEASIKKAKAAKPKPKPVVKKAAPKKVVPKKKKKKMPAEGGC